MTLSGHLGYRDGLLKQYRRYALNFQGYADLHLKQAVESIVSAKNDDLIGTITGTKV